MTDPATLVTFAWDGEIWGFAVRDVVEIASARPVTPVPGLGPCLPGIVSWRGRTLPVILPRRLKRSPGPPEVKSRFLVVRAEAPFAVPLDETGRVVPGEPLGLPEAGIDAEPPSGVRANLRSGATAIRILDPTALAASGGFPAEDEGSDS